MNKKTKPVSRLTLVFILAVLVSGSILTWFSINNISNLKELTEKRIIEEQRQLADSFSIKVQNNLDKATTGFENEISVLEELRETLSNAVDRTDFFTMPFILNNKGEFLFPNFRELPENPVHSRASNRYRSTFQEGEKAEFAQEKLILAKSKYSQCLRYSRNGNDSVKVFNALGRVSVKQKRNAEAVRFYEKIIQEYYATMGNDGFPYMYYAIPQLLKVYSKANAEKIKSIVEIGLTEMKNGAVPLNLYTNEILDEVKKWSKKNVTGDNFQTLNRLITSIEKQLKFINKYKNDISYSLEGNELNRLMVGNGFEVLTLYSANGFEKLIVKNNGENYFGFLVDAEALFNLVLKEEFHEEFEFDYIIELSSAHRNGANTKLIYSAQMNSIFPNQYLQIKLQNENLIDELVKRRSWIYGIASVLLLVAMFLGVVLIIRDISREKRLAGLQADFISNVTHELKTPLTSINMFAESLLLKRVKTSNEKEEYLSIIIKESERLKRMINNILEFSKMEKGKSDYHFTKTNLAGLISVAIQELKYWLDKEKFDVVTELDENIEAEIDSEKMKQAFSNLISNSIKYSVDSKKISISLHQNSRGAVIEIEDEGVGMAEDKVHRIFDKFYRIDQKENVSGTGLGLTVVKEIIEAHEGIIEVISQEGKGSKFSIILKSN